MAGVRGVPDDLVTWLEELKPRFKEALEEQGKPMDENPEKQPFKSKYAAREIFKEVLQSCERKLDGTEEAITDDSVFSFISGTIAILAYHLGVNFVESEEIAEGEQYFERARKLLEPVKLHPRYTNAFTRVLSQEGIVWSNRNDHQKALDKLTGAEAAYTSFSKRHRAPDGEEDGAVVPWRPSELIPSSGSEECWKDFEQTQTHTLYYLAQCYGHLQQPQKSAEYIQLTLRRQFVTKEYNPLEWAVHCGALSQYYVGQCDYASAVHCLLCASKVAQEAKDTEEEEKLDKVSHVDRCWVKYALNVITLPDGSDPPPAVASGVDFGCPVDEEARAAIPTTTPTTFDEAKAIFQLGQARIRAALKHLTLDGHVTDHIEITQDHSRLYQHLARFVSDPDTKCKLHKRRLDMLLAVVGELNPQYFLAMTRQLQFEIAEISHEMMSLKRSKYTNENPPDAAAVAKINKLGLQSIKWFTAFQESCRDTVTKEMPKDLDELVERPFLVAKFTSARIYSQLLVGNPKIYAENMEKCQEGYAWCVKYVDDHPECKCFKDEYPLCQDLVKMLPEKVRREMQAMQQNIM